MFKLFLERTEFKLILCLNWFTWRRSNLKIHWKDWCWSWNSNTLATWFEELTHWKRPWCWERLKTGGEGDDRGRDDWVVSLTQWTWIWANCGRWWRTGKQNVKYHMLSLIHGEGKGYPLQYSGLENSMDCIVHGVSSTWNLKYGTSCTNGHIYAAESWIQRTDLRLTVKAGGKD